MKKRHNPDVLNCLANLSSDEVFTTPSLANEILDSLPKEIFEDKTSTFIDPCLKSGIFLREIAKRLDKQLVNTLPEKTKRIENIFKNQVFGIATTELTSLMGRRTLYCSKKADSKYSLFDASVNESGNIFYSRSNHLWVNSRCKYCGAPQDAYNRNDELETYAYPFIHKDNPNLFFDMKFDVVIGNPPYQISDSGFGKSAKPIYNRFIEQAKKLNPRHLLMIIPSRWYAGGKGLDEFRNEMLNDKRIKKIVDYPEAKDCFPGVDIAGGVCYFHWQRDYEGLTEVINNWRDEKQISYRKLNEFDTFIRFGIASNIIKKIRTKNELTLDSVVSSRAAFGLTTTVKAKETGDLNLITSKGEGKISSGEVLNNKELIPKWKVLTSNISYDHAGQPNKNGERKVLAKLFLAPPNTVCTETYLVIDTFDNQEMAENLEAFLKLKFTRFLIAQMTVSQHITKGRFAFVPKLNWNKKYSDNELYSKYELDSEEINFIEKTIMKME
ncbi:Type III restriction system endonuclease [Prochlorococcus marinus subsp. pastoris str. CCMP1986]|uniref:Type III restriction system endonuclease n=1 Tax=Prochlorococcus marinus subsp. pastoris (strain CCMP1986 / NIES-2087 / MED4) TaxID=59919 RepID=A8WI54_PROMP|nr:Eco57I restriction-modification methylase domain-containing protein [Prochlorococcus marinus]KGF86274.1 putative type III restriction system endonuclease [Prochlorococcus marinus str. EQPAC1]CAP16345.1 Type III restriction system endonuclease [Prochlorococcus marinus subsp. pastoris str. CCMP1986]